MLRILCLITFIGLMPFIANAAMFPKQSVFLSKDNVVQGDTVLVHVIISNTSDSSFSGKLEVLDGTSTIGTLPIVLVASEAKAVSVTWSPNAGPHTLSADLYDQAGILIQEEHATFEIAAPAKTPPPSQIQSSQIVDQQIAKVSPVAARQALPVLDSVDRTRGNIVRSIDTAITWTSGQKNMAEKKNSSGSVLGAQTQKKDNPAVNTSAVLNDMQLYGAILVLYILSALRYSIQNVAIFYPVIAFLFLYILWRATSGIRRPHY